MGARVWVYVPGRVDGDALADGDGLRADGVLQRIQARAVVTRLARQRLDRRQVYFEQRLLELTVVLVHETLATLDLWTFTRRRPGSERKNER